MNIYILLLLISILCGSLPSYAAKTSNDKIYKFTPIDAEFDSISKSLLIDELNFQKNPESTTAKMRRLKEIAESSGNHQLTARALLWETRTGQLQNAPARQIETLKLARQYSDKAYPYDNAFIDYQTAGNYQRIGRYHDAYVRNIKAIEEFRKAGDDYALGNAFLLHSLIYHEIGEDRHALECADSAQVHYQAIGFPLNRIYFFKALMTNDQNESIDLYRKSIEAGSHEPPMTVQALLNIAEIHLTDNRIEQAAMYIAQADSIINGPLQGNPVFTIPLLARKAELAFSQQRYGEVTSHTDTIERLTKDLPSEHLAPSILFLASQASERQGNQAAAFNYLKKYTDTIEALRLSDDAKRIQAANERELIDTEQKKATDLLHAQELRKSRLYILILILLIVCGVISWVAMTYRRRSNRQRLRNLELNTEIEEQRNRRIEDRDRYENDINASKRKVTASNLMISNKNEVLNRIKQLTSEYASSGKLPDDFIASMEEEIGESLRSDDEWGRIKLHFEETDPEFFSKLKAEHPGLTENELRLCAYLRIGMRAKELATMLAVTSASINTARYRLRKKLNLAKDDSLEDYLRNV